MRDRKATKGNYVAFGDFGLQSQEALLADERVRSRLVVLRRTHFLKREGKVYHPGVPGQAGFEEAARDSHGQGQGRRRLLGGAGEARDDAVRAGGCSRADGQGDDGARGGEDAGAVPIRRSPSEGVR